MNQYSKLKKTPIFSEEYKVYFGDSSYHATYINLVSIDPSLSEERFRFLISIPSLGASFYLPMNPSKEGILLKIAELKEPVYAKYAENLWGTIVDVKKNYIHPNLI